MPSFAVRAARWTAAAALAGAAACSLGVAPAQAAPTPTPTCSPGQTTGCTSVGTGNAAAAPNADLAASCGSGITVVLSNINGGQPVTFTVTTPAGSAEDVTVAADKIVRRVYPVAAGVHKPLTVSAPGMATASTALPATCKAATRVLGEKVTRKPAAPAAAAAASSSSQLPFTGPHFPIGVALALGAGLTLAGGVLVRVGARART